MSFEFGKYGYGKYGQYDILKTKKFGKGQLNQIAGGYKSGITMPQNQDAKSTQDTKSTGTKNTPNMAVKKGLTDSSQSKIKAKNIPDYIESFNYCGTLITRQENESKEDFITRVKIIELKKSWGDDDSNIDKIQLGRGKVLEKSNDETYAEFLQRAYAEGKEYWDSIYEQAQKSMASS